MALQNFQDKTTPVVSAGWLNAVDILKETIFNGAADKAGARTGLNSDAPMEIINGGTGSRGGGAPQLVFLASLFPEISQYINPLTPGEATAGISEDMLNQAYLPGDVRRFKPAMDAVTDDTIPLRRWASVGGYMMAPQVGTCVVTDEITIVGGSSILGTKGFTITQMAPNKAIFRAASQTSISIQDVYFRQDPTAIGSSAYVAGVVLDRCTGATVRNCEFSGFQWCGVYLLASGQCKVIENYLHDFYLGEAVTFTAAPAAGATTGTLTANWSKATGQYVIGFVETATGSVEGRVVTLTKGSPNAIDFSLGGVLVGLSLNCDALANVNCLADSAGIQVSSNPTTSALFNIIENNVLANCGQTGISIQDPYSGVLPVKNRIAFNTISVHISYGILIYMPDAGDSYNQVIGNYIAGIQGSFAINQSSGAGIYCVGGGLGGLIVSLNVVRDCCKNTINTTLSPAGIGISGTSAGTAPITVTGNNIDGMTQYHGILLTGVMGGATVTANAIRQPAANITGHGIDITNSDSITVSANTVIQLNTTTTQVCILVMAISANCTNITVTNNTLLGGHFGHVVLNQSGGAQVVGFTIANNTMDGGDSSCVPLQFLGAGAADGTVTGNSIRSLGRCINQATCTAISYSNNRVKGPGAIVLFNLTGVCTSTFWAVDNTGIVPGVAVNNAGTGAVMHFRSSGAPLLGTYAVGDTVFNNVSVSGSPYIWSCTTPGAAPGVAIFGTLGNLS